MTKPPIEMDLTRIEGAIRQLAVLAWEHSFKHYGPDGQWTGEKTQTATGHIIAHPILAACKIAHGQIHAYLCGTIGPLAAAEITARINSETGAKFEAREAAANSDQVRH
jgi:hypothetical protein